MDDNPAGEFSHKINGIYPDGKPYSTVLPGTILAALPRLPDAVEYRFLGRHLILLDTRANVILDRIPCAIECEGCDLEGRPIAHSRRDHGDIQRTRLAYPHADTRCARDRADATETARDPLRARAILVLRDRASGFRVPATRPYSIASSPSSRHAIQLVLNHVPGGPGSDTCSASAKAT